MNAAEKVLGGIYDHANKRDQIKITEYIGIGPRNNRMYKCECTRCGEENNNAIGYVTAGRFKICKTCKKARKIEKEKEVVKKTVQIKEEKKIEIATPVEEVIETSQNNVMTLHESAKAYDILKSDIINEQRVLHDVQVRIEQKMNQLQTYANFIKNELNFAFANNNEDSNDNEEEEEVVEIITEENAIINNHWYCREGLLPYKGTRNKFKMTFDRFGTDKENRRTMLFLDIRDYKTGADISTHHWFLAGDLLTRLNLSQGDIIRITAEVGEYYSDIMCGDGKAETVKKYRLTKIANAKKVGK